MTGWVANGRCCCCCCCGARKQSVDVDLIARLIYIFKVFKYIVTTCGWLNDAFSAIFIFFLLAVSARRTLRLFIVSLVVFSHQFNPIIAFAQVHVFDRICILCMHFVSADCSLMSWLRFQLVCCAVCVCAHFLMTMEWLCGQPLILICAPLFNSFMQASRKRVSEKGK